MIGNGHASCRSGILDAALGLRAPVAVGETDRRTVGLGGVWSLFSLAPPAERSTSGALEQGSRLLMKTGVPHLQCPLTRACVRTRRWGCAHSSCGERRKRRPSPAPACRRGGPVLRLALGQGAPRGVTRGFLRPAGRTSAGGAPALGTGSPACLRLPRLLAGLELSPNCTDGSKNP